MARRVVAGASTDSSRCLVRLVGLAQVRRQLPRSVDPLAIAGMILGAIGLCCIGLGAYRIRRERENRAKRAMDAK
jgi:hypothetical protein